MTDRPSLLLTRKLPEAVEERACRDYEVRLNPHDELLGTALSGMATGADALLICSSESMTAEVIAKLPSSVRVIATYSVGYEHIDLEAARAKGLCVTYTPDVLTDATAETTMLLVLAAARRASEGDQLVRANRWRRWSPTGLLGIEVTGKHLGILGMGRIGRALAKRARGFEMTIHYSNRDRLPPELESDAIYHEDARDMFGQIDFLSINCPATTETHHFLNAERIAWLRDGAVVVNTARGTIIDDDALIAGLKSGKVAAAGLDVFDGEPNIHPGYRELPNTFLLPHLGSGTRETRDAMGFKCLDNLDAFFAGLEPPDRLA